jgi:hypothetical protein
MLGRDELALVANERDFTANQLIDLASSTRPWRQTKRLRHVAR